ncbi:MAG: UDP-N-acetylglucosamine 2-epimerase (non-hydrolyzing) [Deltaproteobacteria bacterium]|nr:UDP-N-acetylglucosamine 2-epimerase (non-hydrolyzing) [Deltaproteobacteria bacterium]
MAWKILCIAGARPNFMKIAPLLRAFAADKRFAARLVHTGQHYDAKLSKVFFEDLAIPRPDVELEVGSGTHAQQTAEIMKRFEPVVEQEQPHGVLVVGDVNSTVGCALVASKLVLATPFMTSAGARTRPLVIHVEAGLRSHDHDMPEETNRIVTDALSDLLFVSEPDGMVNLAREGVRAGKAHLVGNVMIDTMVAARERAKQSTILDTLGLSEHGYGLVTLHRPSNVDDVDALRGLLASLSEVAREMRLVFPVHPRTRKRIEDAGIQLPTSQWSLIEPLGYLDFMRLTSSARVVLTDSGGIQEETTVLGVPCITLRDNTERPITVAEGTNQLVGTKRAAILAAYARIEEVRRAAKIPKLWDGAAAERIVAILGQVLM